MQFNDDTPLGEAIDFTVDAAVNGGAICPCCSQFVKVYKRKINSAMAKALVDLYKEGKTFKFVHGPTVTTCREVSKLSWWGLVVEESTLRPDGGRSGYWRVTKKGEQFIKKQIKCQKYAHVFDGKILNHVGDFINIEDAFGSPFHYNELMNA